MNSIETCFCQYMVNMAWVPGWVQSFSSGNRVATSSSSKVEEDLSYAMALLCSLHVYLDASCAEGLCLKVHGRPRGNTAAPRAAHADGLCCCWLEAQDSSQKQGYRKHINKAGAPHHGDSTPGALETGERGQSSRRRPVTVARDVCWMEAGGLGCGLTGQLDGQYPLGGWLLSHKCTHESHGELPTVGETDSPVDWRYIGR